MAGIVRTIDLTQGKVALVDDESFESLNKHRWQAHKEGRAHYAVRKAAPGETPRQIRMHRVLVGAAKDLQVDHINGDGLDNRKENLRVVTVLQNLHNHTRKKIGCTSRFRGVTWNKKANKWLARIASNGVRLRLGLFEREIDAARAYDMAGRARDPEHFTPNFP